MARSAVVLGLPTQVSTEDYGQTAEPQLTEDDENMVDSRATMGASR